MGTTNDNKNNSTLSIAKCTRIIDEMLSVDKGLKISTFEVYERLERTFHCVEMKGTQTSPNESEEAKYKKGYKHIFVDAVVRLLKILKDKSEIKYLIVSDYPQEQIEDNLIDDILNGKYNIDNASFQYYDTKEENKPPFSTFKDENGNTTDKIYTIECALIIDELLSSGNPVTTQEIYDELEKTYNLTTKSTKSQEIFFKQLDYKGKCKNLYGAVYKEAIQRLLKELRLKGKSNILVISKYEKDKRKRVYQYTEPGFSAFKATRPNNVNSSEFEFEVFASRLYSKDKLSLARLFDILERIDLISSSETGSIEGDINNSLHKIESLIKCKTDDYIIECDKEFKLLFSKYKNHIKPKDYANLLVLYADHIYESGLNKDFKDNIELKEGWYNTISNSLETAVDVIRSTEFTELYIRFALKYASFVTIYGGTDLYDKIEHIYSDIFSALNDYLQNNNTTLMAYALRSYATLCYYRNNIDLCVVKLVRAQDICRNKIYDNTEQTLVNVDYLNEYIFATRNLADVFFDSIGEGRRDRNRSAKEYKDIVEKYSHLTIVDQSLDYNYDFVHHVYKRLAVLSYELNNFIEEEEMYEKCVQLSLTYAIKEYRQKYIDNFEQDIMNWATALRKVYGTTLKDSYMQALEQYMQLSIKQNISPSTATCKVIPKNYFSKLICEVNLFQRINKCRNNLNSIEDNVRLAIALEEIGDLQARICYDGYEIIEKEYSEALAIYQTINNDRVYTFTMINLLGKLSKSFVSQRKMTEADRMYGKLYNLLCQYIDVEYEQMKLHGIEIAHIMTDYASFLECYSAIDKAISVYQHTLSFCDRINAHEKDVITALMSNNSLPATILPSKMIKCDILRNIAMLYERKNEIKEAEKAYRKSIDFCLREEKETPGAYVIYIIFQLEYFAKMLKDHCSYKEADTMISHYLDIINSSPEYYDALISKLPEFNWIKKAKLSVDNTREIVKSEDPWEWNPLLANDLKELADLQCIYKEYADAKDSYQEIIDIYCEIEKDRPGLYATDLASTYSKIASVYKELGMNDEAIQSYEKAKILYEKLSTSEPSYNAEIAKCLKAQAELYESYMNA